MRTKDYYWVPRKPITDAFRRSGLTPQEVAARAGYWRMVEGRRRGDGTTVLRSLGLRKEGEHQREGDTLRYETAVRLVRAMNLDPHEYGV